MNRHSRWKGTVILALTAALAMLLLAPLAAHSEGGQLKAQAPADAYVRDAEIVLINRADGRIVIRDLFVGANMKDLSGKYDAWGGPYYDVAVGDFNGDGTKEIVAIGGRGVTIPGPNLNTFDPVQAPGTAAVPGISTQLNTNVNPYDWLYVQCGDVDGDGRDEIVAIRTTSEPNNISQRIVCYEYEGSAWREKWNKPTGGGFYSLTLGDYDRDGKADLALARVYSYIIVLDGENPDWSHFEAKVGGLADWRKALIGDVTGDRVPELVLLRPQQAVHGNYPPAVLVIAPTGPATWNDVFGWGFGDPPEDAELGDVNGDGTLEIVVVNTGDFARVFTLNPRLSDAQNNRTEEEFWIGDREWAGNLVLGDTNGDGRPQPMLVRANTGAWLRIYKQNDGNYGDESRDGPYWDNFVAANLDGSGVLNLPVMQVPGAVALFYDLSTSAATQATIRVANLGPGTFTWTATQGACPWLTLSRLTGSAGDTITLTLNAAQLPSAPATLTCPVAIVASGQVQNPNQNITVSAVVLSKLYSLQVPLIFR